MVEETLYRLIKTNDMIRSRKIRCFPEAAPRGEKLPYIVYSKLDTKRNEAFSSSYLEERFLISVFSNSFKEAKEVGEELSGYFNEVVPDEEEIIMVKTEGDSTLFELNSKTYVYQFNVVFLVE